MKWFYLGVFGLLGIYSRYFLGATFPRYSVTEFPWTTMIINVMGSTLIGAVYVLAPREGFLSNDMRLAVTVGFLGGFTTFSAFALETFEMLSQGAALKALSYIILSVVLSITGTALGMTFMKLALK